MKTNKLAVAILIFVLSISLALNYLLIDKLKKHLDKNICLSKASSVEYIYTVDMESKVVFYDSLIQVYIGEEIQFGILQNLLVPNEDTFRAEHPLLGKKR